MNPVRRNRMILIAVMVIGIATAVGFALKAFNENLMFFFSVTDVVQGKAPANKDFRLGGMVVNGSVKREKDSLAVMFDLTDYAKTITVYYNGILPDLFREGQGIISKGKMRSDGVFEASEVLAKHDENYMPPEVADSLKNKANTTVQDKQPAPAQ